jgi:hypothetical protein
MLPGLKHGRHACDVISLGLKHGRNACDVISVVAEFMVDVAGVETRPHT